jgi:hypothetical protein
MAEGSRVSGESLRGVSGAGGTGGITRAISQAGTDPIDRRRGAPDRRFEIRAPQRLVTYSPAMAMSDPFAKRWGSRLGDMAARSMFQSLPL